MKIQYQKVSLKRVIECYVEAFEVNIFDYKFFIDQSKDAIIFELVINDSDLTKKEST